MARKIKTILEIDGDLYDALRPIAKSADVDVATVIKVILSIKMLSLKKEEKKRVKRK